MYFLTFSVKARQTASDVFVDYVIEYLELSGQVERSEQVMGPDWVNEIALHTASWSSTNAQYFLNTLKTSGVRSEHILKILQSGSYLQALQARNLHFQFVEGRERYPSANDVFFDFVTEYLELSNQIEEFEGIMGSNWIDEITLHTTSWTSIDAQHFLNTLKASGIESEHILKILQAGSYLQALQTGRLHFEFQATREVIESVEVENHNISQSIKIEFPDELKSPEFAFLNPEFSNDITGHRVFIQFVNAARQYLGTTAFDDIMGSSWDQPVWEEKLTRYMDRGHWTELDVRNFILFLVERIGLDGVLKRMKNNVSYFDAIAYLDFKDKVVFYDKLLGEEVVNELLNKSLGGFQKKNNLSELRAITSFIRKYIEVEEEFKEFIKKRVIDIARATYSDLIGVEQILFEYDFTRDDIKALMQKSFDGFVRAKPESLHSVAEFLLSGKVRIDGQWQQVFDWEDANFTKSEVKALIQESFSGFSSVTPETFRSVVEFLISGEIKIKGQWQPVFDWGDANFTNAEVKVLMQESLKGFARAKPESLRSVAEFFTQW